jgi:hypothetical protein
MIGTRLSIDEVDVFLDANPNVQWIDAFIFDMNGMGANVFAGPISRVSSRPA